MSDIVIVVCKLPHGIILEVGRKKIKLKGSMQLGHFYLSISILSQIVGLTKVPKDLWEAWIKDHQEFMPYKKGLIFAVDKKKRILDEAKEKEALFHGLEPINTSKMPKTLEQIKAGTEL